MIIKWREQFKDGRAIHEVAHELYETGMPFRAIVRTLNDAIEKDDMVTKPLMTRKLLNYAAQRFDWETVPRETVRADYLESIRALPIFNNFIDITSKCITVCNDVHIPFYKAPLMDKMVGISEKFGSKELVVVGDLLDMTAISRFDTTKKQQTLSEEFEIARRVLEVLFEQFDTIYWSMGNHDVRFVKLAEGNFSETDLGKLIFNSLDSKKLKVSPYRYVEINKLWRLTHPSNYSRIPPQVERSLATKFHKNVIGTHGHLFGMGTDISGKYVAAQVGGLVDPERVWYLKEKDTTHPNWVSGFWVIRNDILYPFVDHPNLTDWDFWLNLTF